MSFKEWEEEVNKLDDVNKNRVWEALNTLKEWEPFKEHFGETKMFALMTVIKWSEGVDHSALGHRNK